MGVPSALPGRHAKFDSSGSMFLPVYEVPVQMRGVQLLVLTLSVAIRLL
jgi:hypothetical protein